MTKQPPDSLPLTIHPSNNRLTQVARINRQKQFDEGRKAIFLEWFAATCNVTLSAEKAGITYQTVYKHRRKDTAFAEAWDEALAQGYAALEAGLLADAIAAEIAKTAETGVEGEAPPAQSPLSFEQRMALLKEYRRVDGNRGPRGVGKAPSQSPYIATPAEAEAALIKRLKHFAMRVAEADAEGRSVLDEPRTSTSGIPIIKADNGKSE